MAKKIGYDLHRGRLDTTVHPFEVSFTRNDVRITTRINEHWMPSSLFGSLHEAGHALYEQYADPAFVRTPLATDLVGLYAVSGVSFGAHESQSRLFENHVGRSREFWELNFPEAQAAFPEQLADVDVETFWRGVNCVAPGLIRVEADELTYDFHIMLRVDIEAALVDGSLQVRDLPAAWNAKIQEYLGLDVPNDRLGVLQDVHWSSGQIGTFCNYTIGNVMAGQLFETAVQDTRVSTGLSTRRLHAAARVDDRPRAPARPPLHAQRAAPARHRPSARSRALHRAPHQQVLDHLRTLTPMPTTRLAQRAALKDSRVNTRLQDLADSLTDVIRMGRGDPDFDTPPHIVRAGQEALAKGATHYTHAQGILPLRQAIAADILARGGASYTPAQIVVTPGAQQATLHRGARPARPRRRDGGGLPGLPPVSPGGRTGRGAAWSTSARPWPRTSR